MHDFFDMYTRQLIAHNHEYQELKYLEHKLQERFDILHEEEKVSEEGSFLLYSPSNWESTISVQIVNAQILDVPPPSTRSTPVSTNPMARIFVYIDDVFQGKTELMDPSNYPIFDLHLDLLVKEANQEIRFDLYDASGLTKQEIFKIRE